MGGIKVEHTSLEPNKKGFNNSNIDKADSSFEASQSKIRIDETGSGKVQRESATPKNSSSNQHVRGISWGISDRLTIT